MDDTNRVAAVRWVLVITLILNVLVCAAKIIYGTNVNSVAVVSDGLHSLFDGFSNVLGLIGMYYASNKPDERHPYGHRKFETVFTVFIGVMMFATCFEIFNKSYTSFMSGATTTAGGEAFVVMLVTLGVNVFVSTYEKRRGRELSSEFLIADAGHTLSDIYVTCGVITGLLISRLGYPKADPAVGVVVGLMVAWAGFKILRITTAVLVDESTLDNALVEKTVCSIEGVKQCHKIRSRGPNGSVFLDLHVVVEPALTVDEGHKIAHAVQECIKANVVGVVDVVVHIEPRRGEETGGSTPEETSA
jgi:cation diffusion facilitator family transporter